MKRVTLMTAALALGMIFVAAYQVQGQEERERQRPGREGRQRGPQAAGSPLERLTAQVGRLNLTDEQKKDVDKILAERKEKLTKLQEQARPTEKQREAIRAAMTKAREDGVERGEIPGIIAKAAGYTPEQTKAQEELNQETRSLMAAISEVLTPEQRQQLRSTRPGQRGQRGEGGRPAGRRPGARPATPEKE